jgi:uncharacterized protein
MSDTVWTLSEEEVEYIALMDTFNIAGIPTTPAALADEKGNVLVIAGTRDALWTERPLSPWVARPDRLCWRCAALNSRRRQSGAAIPWPSGSVEPCAKRNTNVSGSRKRLPHWGRDCCFAARTRIFSAPLQADSRGMVALQGFAGDAGSRLRIAIQNENLVAWRDEQVVITVPDLICILDDDTGESIGTEVLRYGMRVSVLAFVADPKLTTPAGLAVVGPRAFGYDLEYRPFIVDSAT